MSALHVAHVRLGSHGRQVPWQAPQFLETVRSREAALQLALQDAYGYAQLADFDDDFVYFAAEGMPGLNRQRYTDIGDGNMTLDGEPARVRPRSSYQPAKKGTQMQSITQAARDAVLADLHHRCNEMLLQLGTRPDLPEVDNGDYAALQAPPEEWGGWGDRPVPYRPPAALDPAHTTGIRLHNIAALGSADDYSEVTFTDRPPADPGDRDFSPCKSMWD